MAQRDPLVEYQREGFQLFQAMMESIKEESVGYLFNVNVEVDQPAPAVAAAPMSVSDMLAGSGMEAGAAEPAAPGEAAAEAAVGEEAVAAPEQETEEERVERLRIRAKGLEQPVRAAQLHYSAPTAEGGVEVRDVTGGGTTLTEEQLEETPKNAPCPCGSGKKFKMCHGAAKD
jgi:preprotein translocase subunit SecA